MAWYVYSLIGVAAVSVVGLLEKKTLRSEHSLEYAVVFSIVKFVLFIITFGPTIDVAVTPAQFVLLGLTGCLSGFAFLMVAKAIRISEISSIFPILALQPGVVALLALAVLGETVSSRGLIGIGLMLAGTYVLELKSDHRLTEPKVRFQNRILEPFRNLFRGKNNHFALIGLGCYAIASVIDRWLLKEIDSSTYLLYGLAFVTLINVILFLGTNQQKLIFKIDHRPVLVLTLIAASLHLVSNLAQVKAVSLTAVGLVVAIKQLSVLIDVLLAGRLFHEHNVRQKLVASTAMLAGVFFIVQS